MTWVPVAELCEGDVVEHGDTEITVLRLSDNTPVMRDRFGREFPGMWCRRNDTGAEGYVSYGPGAKFWKAGGADGLPGA